MKQIEVTILGQSYILGCPEGGESDLLAAVNTVDREMCAIRDAGRVKARERIAVLAALNLAYALEQRTPAPMTAQSLRAERAGATDHDDAVDLDRLIRRVDQALGEDGQLI
jgi:cell division protein ZapA